MRAIVSAVITGLILLSPASAARWNVDHAKSRLGFTVQWGGEPFVATFKSWSAEITFDPAHVGNAKASVVIDLGSESSDSADNDDGLKGPEGFSIAQFPMARFATTAFVSKGGGSYLARGRLNIHGMSRPVSLPFTLTIVGDTAHMIGSAVVMRTDFGLGRGEWASAATIAREVMINVDLTATKVR